MLQLSFILCIWRIFHFRRFSSIFIFSRIAFHEIPVYRLFYGFHGDFFHSDFSFVNMVFLGFSWDEFYILSGELVSFFYFSHIRFSDFPRLAQPFLAKSSRVWSNLSLQSHWIQASSPRYRILWLILHVLFV